MSHKRTGMDVVGTRVYHKRTGMDLVGTECTGMDLVGSRVFLVGSPLITKTQVIHSIALALFGTRLPVVDSLVRQHYED